MKTMESLQKLSEKLIIDENILKICRVQLISKQNIEDFLKNDDWMVSLKVDIEYELTYEKL